MKRQHWLAFVATGAVLDLWCAYGRGGDTLSTAIRKTYRVDTPAGYVAWGATVVAGATWLHFHIVDPRKFP